MMEIFLKIVNNWKPLTIIDDWKDSIYTWLISEDNSNIKPFYLPEV